eukprot:61719-Amphidinium_carterae.1
MDPSTGGPIRITVEGDDACDIGSEATPEAAAFMTAGLRQFGFLGEQSCTRVFLNRPGPPGATSFCS